jgi:hypothetical protein
LVMFRTVSLCDEVLLRGTTCQQGRALLQAGKAVM